ncbi:subtilase-type protease inhibitor [Streptomyces sp. NBC_01136]|uniref:SSI family serine proteinase inhibitor n=1 Tax=unclassified Streptomyces TaxID=2593676 RepID=UPI00324FA5B4|nr:subtilase-type protease inhibitor [Streptomyces sp. NBC_01136]
MTRNTQAVRGGLLAAVALLTLGAAPARSAPQEPTPGNWLFLTVTSGDAHSSSISGTLLRCDPPQGHPHAAEACAELAAADGDISRIPPKPDVLCAMIYAPVTASARGQWAGRQVEYTHTFSNFCVLGAETGSVFALSD